MDAWDKNFECWHQNNTSVGIFCELCGCNKPLERHEMWCPNEPDRTYKDDNDFWYGLGTGPDQFWYDEEADVCDSRDCSDSEWLEEWTADLLDETEEDWTMRDRCLGIDEVYPSNYTTGHPPLYPGIPGIPGIAYSLNGETRITDPATGGQKGSKGAQLGAVDPLALLEVAKVAGFGGEKYERYNFAKGYRYSLSYDALQRHLLAFWAGENNDVESGLPHLAHAAWHCLALLTFTLRGLGTDDRFPR